ncbi:MAG TPA: methyltransferase domain-containing protein [Bryobacteraceae bacterium]|nr:methyltransferase domain-containing protein [Bryobacteraceae bacterium]
MNNTTVETYTPGHTQDAVAFMARRSAATHAGFFVPLLRPGMRILDCGCGPGAITLDLARLVKPGAVTGIDRSDDQFAPARRAAAQEELPVQFHAADIYDLDFPSDSFDGVFAHALFEHLREPEKAAQEIGRVLKPGGFAGLRSPDWGGFLLHPYPPPVADAIACYQELMRKNGGDPYAGRKLAAVLRAAGFTQVTPSASYEIYQDAAVIAEYLARQLEEDGVGGGHLRVWGKSPEALFAQAWVEAIGWKA